MLNKTTNYVKYFNIMVLVIIFFAVITTYNLYLYKLKVEETYHQNSLISQKIAFDSTINKFRLITTYIYDKELNKKEILELLDKSINSKEEKDRRYYKGLLYRSLYPLFIYAKKDGIRQIHFQTADNKSFLRFHEPSKYGDDLSKARESIKYVNEKKIRVNTFETGKLLSGFRNIFPIFYKDMYLGSVEVSLSLKLMIDSLKQLDSRKEYHFILNKNFIESKIFEQQKYLYTNSNINSNFVKEDTNNILEDSASSLSEIAEKINEKLAKNSKIQRLLKEGSYISEIVEISDKRYNVIFLPLEGVNNNLEGYLISYSEVNNVPTLVTHFSFFLFIIVFACLLILILLKIIKDKTQKLNDERNWFFQINNSLSEGLYVTDLNSKIKYINPIACQILGYSEDELIGKNAHYLFHHHEKNNYSEKENCNILNEINNNRIFQSDEEYFRLKNKQLIPVEITAQKLIYNKNEEIITTFRDLTVKKELENKKNLLKTALNFCSDSIVITDKDANIEWANPAFEKLTGYKLEEIEGKKPKEFVKSGLQTQDFYEEMWSTILSKKPWKGELINKRKDNSLYHEELSITPILDIKNEIKHFIAVKQNITDKKNKEKEVEYFAFYDYLTNLPNRRMFNEHFKKILESFEKEKKHIAILFLDLDKFKLLNDSKGHDYGDELLKEFSKRLSKVIRNIDFVARLGGDEFVIILDNLPINYLEATQICEKIAIKILNLIREPFVLKDFEYLTSTSIGIYILDNALENLEEIIKKSDIALYEAKERGRNTYYIFNN